MVTDNMENLKKELMKVIKELPKKAGKGKNKEQKDLEPNELRGIMENLTKSLELVQKILDMGEDSCPKVTAIEEKLKRMEDAADHHHQRSLRGKFVISSSKINNKIAKKKELEDQGKSVPQYVVEILNNKLGARVREEDLTSCHHTNTGLVFRMGDQKPGSAFSRVVSAIKTGQGKDVTDIFVNFALTPRRASLLYEIRMLKKSPGAKVTKFYTDYDGNISVVGGVEGKKERVTSIWEREVGGRREEQGAAGGGGRREGEARVARAGHFYTMTAEEVRERFGGRV